MPLDEASELVNEPKFSELWREVFDGAINRGINKTSKIKLYKKEMIPTLKDFVKSEYLKIRRIIKDNSKNPQLPMDRHKIAAALYVSFISATKSYPLLKHSEQTIDMSDIENFIYHTIAFEISLSIISSMILDAKNIEDKNENENYIEYLKSNGFMPPPEKICEHDGFSYYDYTIAQIHRTTIKVKDTRVDIDPARIELFVLLLSNIFFHIERNSRDCFSKYIPLQP